MFVIGTAEHENDFAVTLTRQRRQSSIFANDAAELVYNISGELRRHSLLQQQQQESTLSVAVDLQDTVSYGSETEILYNADVVSDLVYRIGNELSLQTALRQRGDQPTCPVSKFQDEVFSSNHLNSQVELNSTMLASGDLVYCKTGQMSQQTSSLDQPILHLNDVNSENAEDLLQFQPANV